MEALDDKKNSREPALRYNGNEICGIPSLLLHRLVLDTLADRSLAAKMFIFSELDSRTMTPPYDITMASLTLRDPA